MHSNAAFPDFIHAFVPHSAEVHQKFTDHFGLSTHDAAIFQSGVAAARSVIQRYARHGCTLFLDQTIAPALYAFAQMVGCKVQVFRHNDLDHLHSKLIRNSSRQQMLVCCEALCGIAGDFAHVSNLIALAKRFGAKVMVDESHSILWSGQMGRGVCAEQGVLDEVDWLVFNLCQGFGVRGGVVYAKQENIECLETYRCAGMADWQRPRFETLDIDLVGQVLIAARSDSGVQQRQQLHAYATQVRHSLARHVDIGQSQSWLIPVIFGSHRLVGPIQEYANQLRLSAEIIQYPRVSPKRSRLRLVLSPEHTFDEIVAMVENVLLIAQRFKFRTIDLC